MEDVGLVSAVGAVAQRNSVAPGRWDAAGWVEQHLEPMAKSPVYQNKIDHVIFSWEIQLLLTKLTISTLSSPFSLS